MAGKGTVELELSSITGIVKKRVCEKSNVNFIIVVRFSCGGNFKGSFRQQKKVHEKNDNIIKFCYVCV